MKILSMEGEHLLSFQEKFEVPMSDLGLVVVKGENEVSEAADSNGAGKTSLIVTIPSWILFGMTPGGLRGDEIACRFTDEQARGRMVLEDERGKWAITRTRRPATLSVEGTDWDGEDMKSLQVRIESRLGWGFKTFRNAIIFGQGNFERFSLAEQGEQMKMLDEIQGVDFTRALARAETWRKDLKAKLDHLEHSIRVDEEAMARLETSVNQLEQARRQFDENKRARVSELEGMRARAVTERDHALKRMEDLIQRQEAIEEQKKLWRAIDAQSKLVAAAAKDADSSAANVKKEERLLEGKESQVEGLISAGRCPTCRTKFTPDVVGKIRVAYEPDLTEARQALSEARAVADRMQHAYTLAAAKLKSLAKMWPYPSLDISHLTKLEAEEGSVALEQIRREYTRLGGEVERLTGDISAEEKKTWEAQTTLETTKQELSVIRTRLKESRVQVTRSIKGVKVAAYWVQAFGDRGMRSLLVDSVAGFLNDRLAHHLSILAGGEVMVEVSATTALKSGGQKERLSITPVWAWGAAGAGLGSAGQDRRVDLALFAALQDLAESRSARPFPLKIFDEPFDALDTKGKEIAVTWAKEQAAERGTVFLMTHSEEVSSVVSADEIWTVILDKDGSHVVRS
jgi:DNA repair exonuclease SbcCD ATPase subunit